MVERALAWVAWRVFEGIAVVGQGVLALAFWYFSTWRSRDMDHWGWGVGLLVVGGSLLLGTVGVMFGAEMAVGAVGLVFCVCGAALLDTPPPSFPR